MNKIEAAYTYMVKVSNKLLSRAIIPDDEYHDVKDINLDEIKKWKKEYGIGGVIIDIDGTMRHDFENVDYRNLQWLMKMKKELQVCIVSNAFDKKIETVAKKMEVPYLSYALKPLKHSFIDAANKMGLEPQNVLVVGDEYLADIWGAQRSGMWAAAIKKNSNEKSKKIKEEER